MINITKHAYERYASRIKGVSKNELQCDIAVNKELYAEQMNKMFEQSKIIYFGKFDDRHGDTNFRLVDNMMLVTDKNDTKIITIFMIGYGFDREVDNIITKNLLSQLEEKDSAYLEIMEKVSNERYELEVEREQLKDEISSLEETLTSMRESLKSLNSYIEKFGYEENIAKLERDKIAKRICYSNSYRKIMEELVD